MSVNGNLEEAMVFAQTSDKSKSSDVSKKNPYTPHPLHIIIEVPVEGTASLEFL